MPTPLAHFAVPLLARQLTLSNTRLPVRLLLLGFLCSAAPDLDVAAFKLGIPYESQWGHRGFTHSIAFAFLMGAFFAQANRLLGAKRITVFWFITLAWASHGVLDAFTNGGLGIAFLWPMNDTRYFMPWQVTEVSPIGPRFFSKRGLEVLWSEFIWIEGPTIASLGLLMMVRRLRHK